MSAIEICDLTRTYSKGSSRRRRSDQHVALDQVNLDVPEGEIHGLLGPNGAGKTTLVKVITTILLPTSGSVRVLTHDVVTDAKAVRRLIGLVLGGDRGLYSRLTVDQNLRYWATLHGLGAREAQHRCGQLIKRFGLEGWANARVETLSRGMKQRVHLARGLVGEARVLLLDEPTTGMDPVAAREFRSVVRELRQEGRTILLTTHDMAEAEELCDRVTLIDHGRVLVTEPPETLSVWLSRYEHVDVTHAPQALLDRIVTLDGVLSVAAQGGETTRIKTCREGATEDVLRELVSAGVTALRTGRPNLADVYIELIGDRGLDLRA